MNKLFVITYKRPALPIENVTMNIDTAYDCEALPSEELAQIRLRYAKNRYEDVSMFECDLHEFLKFTSDDDMYTEFVKTGDHPLKPIEGTTIEEGVDVGANTRTETINLILEMVRPNEETSFSYHVDIDDVGQVVFTPDDSSVSFVDIERLAGYDFTTDIVDGNTRRFSVSLTSNMLADDDNFEWFCDIDEIGQAVITPNSESTSFLTVSVNGSLNLVTECNESLTVEEPVKNISEDFQTTKEICNEVIDDLEKLLYSAIEKVDTIKRIFRDVGIHNADIDRYMKNYLENFIEGRAGDVSVAEFRNRLDEFEVENETVVDEDIDHDSINEDLDEIDRHEILNRFMKGEISIFSEDGDGDEKYVHLTELDTVYGKTAFKYYYDEESDSIICYSSKALV